MITRIAVVALALAAVAGCGKSEQQQQAEQALENIEQGAQAMQDAADKMGNAQQNAQQMAEGMSQMAQGFAQMAQGSAKAVDFERLVALLPEADGWTRSDARGEQLSMPVAYSRAEAVYRNDESRIDLEITDSGMSQLLLAPLSMMLGAGFSERSSEGFKHAVEIGGHPGFEEWNNGSKRAEVTALVANRFIVKATGHDVEDTAPVRRLVEAVNAAGLEKLE